ncbi:MAG: choline TMA-lyase-activating enzyme, partial [Lacrimispora sphenoides]
RKFQVMYKQNSCVNCGACADVCPVGIHVISKETGKHEIQREKDCIGCMKCKNVCPNAALTIAGEVKTISELLKIVEEDSAFYDISGGGVTLGGGEVTAQPEAALNLLMACKQEGINTAIETCGYTNTETILKIAEYVDLFLFDIKHMDPVRHNELVGVNNEQILTNLKELLHHRFNVKVRMPMLKGINDSREEIDEVIKFLMPFRDYKNFKGIDLLPYHKLGVNKYNQLDMKYPIEGDPSLSPEDLDRIEGWMKEYQFPVTVVKH